MRIRLLWFLRFPTPLFVWTSVLFISPLYALAESGPNQTEPPIPADSAVLELDFPPGAEISIDGVPQGDRRRIEFRPFPGGVTGQYEIKAKRRDGRELSRKVLLRRGWHVNLIVRAELKCGLVVETGHFGWSVSKV